MPVHRLQGGLVFDGLGSDPVVADVVVSGDRIATVAAADPARHEADGAGVLDVRGRWVLPGFIDPHSHADFSVFDPGLTARRHAAGITTEVVGQDGIGPIPAPPDVWSSVVRLLRPIAGEPTGGPWETYADYLEDVRNRGASRAVAFASHATIRRQIVGDVERPATEPELDRMVQLADDLAKQGMPGLSTGLSYPPARAATTEEVRELYAPFRTRGRPYVTHLRDYGEGFDESLEEAVRITSGGWLHLSHLHVSGSDRAGLGGRYRRWLEHRRKEGLTVTFDSYPYTAACTFLHSFLPPTALEAVDTRAELREHRETYAASLDARGPGRTVAVGWSGFHLAGGVLDDVRIDEGLSLTDLAASRKTTHGTTVIDLCIENPDGLTVLIEQGHEDNIEELAQDPGHLVGSDGIMGDGLPHPRATGAFLRFLTRSADGRSRVPVPEMVARATSRCADLIGRSDLGRIAPGALADVITIDPTRLADGPDLASFHPDAVRDVVLGGRLVRREAVADTRLGLGDDA